MSPDSALGILAQRVARLEQRVDDLTARAVERISDLADGMKSLRSSAQEDLKVFGPMIQDHAAFRADMRHMTAALDKALGKIDALEDRLDIEREERIAGQLARKEELEAAIAQRRREEQARDLEAKKMEEARVIQHNELASRFRLAVLSFLGLMLTSGVSAVVAIVIAKGGGG